MEQALPKVLGILGGLGPMATVYFYEMLTRHTQAARDQDHIDVIINSRATTPDRTSYILGQSAENPFDIMAADAARLVTFGADVIAIPCNTAHYFYDRLNETIPIPILNMVEETVLAAKAGGSARVGILATTGTVRTRTYQRMCEKHGLPCAVPDDAAQAAVMDIIYGDIKAGRGLTARARVRPRHPGLHRAFAHQTRRGAGRFLSGLHGGACQKRDPRVRQNAHRLRLKRGQRRHYLHRGSAPRQTGGNT